LEEIIGDDNNIKIYIREIISEVVDWIQLASDIWPSGGL
jgi:hypothetical protein